MMSARPVALINDNRGTARMIRLTGVSRTFAGTVEALREIDLEVGEGEFVAVVGLRQVHPAPAPPAAAPTTTRPPGAAPSCANC